MAKWLIKWYPIEPAQNLTVYNLDVLEFEDYCSKVYQNEVWDELSEYKLGTRRRGFSINNDCVFYNNKAMLIVESESVKEAIKEFWNKLNFKEEHNE